MEEETERFYLLWNNLLVQCKYVSHSLVNKELTGQYLGKKKIGRTCGKKKAQEEEEQSHES